MNFEVTGSCFSECFLFCWSLLLGKMGFLTRVNSPRLGSEKTKETGHSARCVALCVCCLLLLSLSSTPLATSSWVPALSKPRSLEYGSELRGSLRLLAALSTAEEQSCEVCAKLPGVGMSTSTLPD